MTSFLALHAIASTKSSVPQDAETAKLAFFVGKWKAEEVLHMAPNKPKFEVSAIGNWTLAKRAISFGESYDMMGQHFENHILIRYNANDKAYRLWMFSSMSPEPMVFSGSFSSDKSLVFNSEIGKSGFAKQLHRLTYSIVEGGFDSKLDVQYGETWSPMTSAKYRKS